MLIFNIDLETMYTPKIYTSNASTIHCKVFEDYNLKNENGNCSKGSFKNHVDIILPFSDHPHTSVDTFVVLNIDKNIKFLTTHQPPWTLYLVNMDKNGKF